MLVLLLVAHPVPPTVAQPPRMVPAVLAVEVVTPLVAPIVPVGWVKSTVPPTLRVIAPSDSNNGLAVAFAVKTTALAPALSVVPLVTVWLLVVEALPVRFSVPPPSARAEELLMILVAGAPVAEKSSFSVPVLTIVLPV